VPLSQIRQMLEADASTFAEAVQRIDSHLRDEIVRRQAYQAFPFLVTLIVMPGSSGGR